MAEAQVVNIFIGTWNVRTLYSSGALEILTRELDQSPLDVVALQEVYYTGDDWKT